jgi:hypothetical protein
VNEEEVQEQELGTAHVAPVTPETTVHRSKVEALLDEWWNKNFPGSPVSRNTAAWNHASAAFAGLKTLLRGL